MTIIVDQIFGFVPAPDDNGFVMHEIQNLVVNVAPDLNLLRSLTAGVVTGLHARPEVGSAVFNLRIEDEPFYANGRNTFVLKVYNHRANPRLSSDAFSTQVPLVSGDGTVSENGFVSGNAIIPLPIRRINHPIEETPNVFTIIEDTQYYAIIRVQNRPDAVTFHCNANAEQFDAVSRFFMNVVRAALNMDPL